ncbi:MAG: threonine dehydratase [Planctomycetia bacterium]|nr:threonine dehydratase [Planctomycetia bacterium]
MIFATELPPLPTLSEIASAAVLIEEAIPPTPAYAWPLLNEALGCDVWIKHENHTPLGAFKVRGGFVYLDELLKAEPKTPGVIAASTGNHGQSIAWNARRRGLRAVIVVPENNNPEKNAAMRALGAELVEHGDEFQAALEHSRELAAREGLHPVPSFHPWLVRGVATYGLEWFHAMRARSVPLLDAIYVPIGLGSGFCGLAAAREALGMQTRLIGVVSEHAPAYALSFRAGRLTTEPSKTRVAEGVACSTPHELALRWILRYADDIVTVSDDEALRAMRELLRTTHNLAEGAGALALAAITKDRERWKGRKIGCVLSGGNASAALIAQALAR